MNLESCPAEISDGARLPGGKLLAVAHLWRVNELHCLAA